MVLMTLTEATRVVLKNCLIFTGKHIFWSKQKYIEKNVISVLYLLKIYFIILERGTN